MKRSEAKKKKDKEWEVAKKLVAERAKGLCEVRLPDCFTVMAHTHHIRLRSRGGLHDLDNLLGVCLSCHDYIHRNPAEAKEKGLMR